MKTAAIICAQGIGDGLLMMIAAHQLKRNGYEVTLFHNEVKELSSLFKGYRYLPYPSNSSLQEVLNPYSIVVIENDNSQRAWQLFALRNKGILSNLVFFFPTKSKNQLKNDFLFDSRSSMATNIVNGCIYALGLRNANKENGLLIPETRHYRSFRDRIVIHPTSNDIKRNWLPSQYIKLCDWLKNEGFSISFITGPKERKEWLFVEEKGIQLPPFGSIKEVAEYIYESGFFIGNDSGIGHLASNLSIPTLTISGNPKRVRLWRPDWCIGKVVTIPFSLPNFKGINFRFRENYWQYFIPESRTINAFQDLIKVCNHL